MRLKHIYICRDDIFNTLLPIFTQSFHASCRRKISMECVEIHIRRKCAIWLFGGASSKSNKYNFVYIIKMENWSAGLYKRIFDFTKLYCYNRFGSFICCLVFALLAHKRVLCGAGHTNSAYGQSAIAKQMA